MLGEFSIKFIITLYRVMIHNHDDELSNCCEMQLSFFHYTKLISFTVSSAKMSLYPILEVSFTIFGAKILAKS